MVAVTGGEPLMRADIFDVLAEIGLLGFPWGMVTNGMLVDEKVVRRCAETGMRTVSISLDGNEEAHNWLRRNPQSFSKAVNAIKLFSQAGFLGLLGVITCAHPRNVDHLEELYHFLRSIGVEEWRIFNIFPKGRAKINHELVSDGAMLQKVLTFIKAKREEDPDYPISFCEEGYLGCSWERLVRDFPFYCGAGVNIGGLLCDGSYSACPSLSREWVQGNVSELPFHEAWETRYQNMRNRRWMKNDWCGDCREWKNCQGSSLHTWDWETNRPQMCHFRMLNEDK